MSLLHQLLLTNLYRTLLFIELRFFEFEPHWKIGNEEALIIQLSMFIENTVIIGTGTVETEPKELCSELSSTRAVCNDGAETREC